MCVCARRVKRQRRTTLLLNWVVGNTLLWQLLFAGPGAKSCFSLPLSLPHSRSFLCSSSLALPLSLPSSSPFFFPPLPIRSPARSLIDPSLGLPRHSPLGCLFLPRAPRLRHHSFFILLQLPLSSLLFLPLQAGKRKKKQARVVILTLNCHPQKQIEILI